MPEALKKKLRAQGRKKGYTGKRLDDYVYATLATIDKLRKQKKK